MREWGSYMYLSAVIPVTLRVKIPPTLPSLSTRLEMNTVDYDVKEKGTTVGEGEGYRSDYLWTER